MQFPLPKRLGGHARRVFQRETDHKKTGKRFPEIGFEKRLLRWMLSDGAGAVYQSDRPIQTASA